jgi:hypothetical protein
MPTGRIATWGWQWALIHSGRQTYFGTALDYADDIPWDERCIGMMVHFRAMPPDPGGRHPRAIHIVRATP